MNVKYYLYILILYIQTKMTKHTKRNVLRKSRTKRNKLRKNKSRKNYKRGGDEIIDGQINKFLKEIETYYVSIEKAYTSKDPVINGDSILIDGVVVCDYIIEKLSLLIESHDQKLIKIPGYTAYNPDKDNWIPKEKIKYGIPKTFGPLYPKMGNDNAHILPESKDIDANYKEQIQKYINYINLIRNHYAFLLNTELVKILSSILDNKYGNSISPKDKNSIIYMFYYGVPDCDIDSLFDELIKVDEMPQSTGIVRHNIIINGNESKNINIEKIIACIETDNTKLINESNEIITKNQLPPNIRTINTNKLFRNNQDYFIQFFNTKKG